MKFIVHTYRWLWSLAIWMRKQKNKSAHMDSSHRFLFTHKSSGSSHSVIPYRYIYTWATQFDRTILKCRSQIVQQLFGVCSVLVYININPDPHDFNPKTYTNTVPKTHTHREKKRAFDHCLPNRTVLKNLNRNKNHAVLSREL